MSTKARPATLSAMIAALTVVFALTGPPAIADAAATLVPITSSATADAPDYRDDLEAIVGTQSAAEIAAVVSSSGHVELLVDSGTGEILAAIAPTPALSPFALSPVGPGCTTTSLCMRTTSNVPLRYTGSGSLNGTWNNIIRVTPGNFSGAFTWNGLRNAYAANVTVNLTSAVMGTKIERS